MAQWTFRYTTLENPSNYITVTGNVIDGKITEFPYELAQSFSNGNPELMNISFIFPNTVNYIREIFYIANNGANGAFNPSVYFNKVRNIEDLYDLSNCNTLFYSGFDFFYYLKSIKNLYNTSKVTNMGQMFRFCNNLITVSNFNTSKVTDMSEMFRGCRNLTNVPNFDTSNVTNMSRMLQECNLKNIPDFDTSNVTNMAFMFSTCENLINIPNFDTSNVKNMSFMFYSCYNLINVPNFNTTNVTDMSNMFSCDWFDFGSKFLKIKNIPDFDTSNVTNMSGMFNGCSNLINISNFDTSNVKNMSHMFSGCNNLTTTPNFDTSNVTNMKWMFSSSRNLITIPNLNTINVKDMQNMFTSCYNLINIPLFNTSNVINMGNMFNSCYNLSNLSLKNIARSLPNVSQLTSQNSNLQDIGLSEDQINYISTTKYASQLQARGWNIEDNYIKPDLVKSLKMKQSDGTMNLAMLGTNAEYVDMEDGTTLEDAIQDLKQYIDDSIANILGGMY